MPPPPFGSAHRAELADRTGYELWAVAHYRSCFERPTSGREEQVCFTLGKVDESGKLVSSFQSFNEDNFAQAPVQASLAHFRPLVFTAAFKLQDMISEWILEASTGQPAPWSFAGKRAQYASLRRRRGLREPPEFRADPTLGQCHWALYEALEPPRGAVIHQGGIKLHGDGRLEVVDRNKVKTVLSEQQQDAYVRFACVLTQRLTGAVKETTRVREGLHNDLASLAPIHSVSGLVSTHVRYARARVVVPETEVATQSPVSFAIDVSDITRQMAACFLVGAGRLDVDLEITGEVQGRQYHWRIPPEHVPDVPAVLRADDPTFARFFEIAPIP